MSTFRFIAWIGLIFIISLNPASSFAEPVDDVFEQCTQTTTSFDEIVQNFERAGWLKVSDRNDAIIWQVFAAAQIGNTIRGNPSMAAWQNAMDLRISSARGMLNKPDRDFFRSILLKPGDSIGPEYLYISWVKLDIGVGLKQIRCQYAGQRFRNAQLARNIEKQLSELSDMFPELVSEFPEIFIGDTNPTGPLKDVRIKTSLTLIDEHKANGKLKTPLLVGVGFKSTISFPN